MTKCQVSTDRAQIYLGSVRAYIIAIRQPDTCWIGAGMVALTVSYAEVEMVIARRLEKIAAIENRTDKIASFILLPGQLFCDWFNIQDEESVILLRIFINLSIYGKVAILMMLPFLD